MTIVLWDCLIMFVNNEMSQMQKDITKQQIDITVGCWGNNFLQQHKFPKKSTSHKKECMKAAKIVSRFIMINKKWLYH